MIERARPLLGTYATVRIADADPHEAIDKAFAAIAEVQALMSAFESDSDLTRIHAQPCLQSIPVNALTAQVLAFGIELSRQTAGVFDMCLGGEGAVRGILPIPVGAHYSLADVRNANWQDIEVHGFEIMLKRPLWLDLSGIAKGFAVDQGIAALKACGVSQGTVNIGGDLATFGPAGETVDLRLQGFDSPPEIEIQDGAVAASGGAADWVKTRHLHGRSRDWLNSRTFACVIAPDCLSADALTKVVLAGIPIDTALLAHYGAKAVRYDNEWQVYGDTHEQA